MDIDTLKKWARQASLSASWVAFPYDGAYLWQAWVFASRKVRRGIPHVSYPH